VLTFRTDTEDCRILGAASRPSELGAEEGALEIDGHHPVVLVLSGVEDRGAGLHAGVIHHDVHSAERAHGLVDKPFVPGVPLPVELLAAKRPGGRC